MNEWPDDLWQAERSLTRATLARYANDAVEETGDSPSTTASNDPKVEPGTPPISSSSAEMEPKAATGGWKPTPMMLRHKGIGVNWEPRHT